MRVIFRLVALAGILAASLPLAAPASATVPGANGQVPFQRLSNL